jgi:A/G-specific adenine glycosylase
MELGATRCTPTRPRCGECPLAASCVARATARQDALPIVPARRRAAELPRVRQVAAWIERDGRVLLARRPAKGLYGGLWELPQASDRAALAEAFAGRRELAARAAARHRQLLSHRRLEIELVPATLRGRTPRLAAYERTAWYAHRRVGALGLSTATRAVIDRYLEKR